jgi:5-methylcytosine-specific restriction endonuclease McrA
MGSTTSTWETPSVDSEDSWYIPSDVNEAVWIRDGGKCVICGRKRQLEYDHVIPYSRGGSNTVNNIQILWSEWNRRKSGKI